MSVHLDLYYTMDLEKFNLPVSEQHKTPCNMIIFHFFKSLHFWNFPIFLSFELARTDISLVGIEYSKSNGAYKIRA